MRLAAGLSLVFLILGTGLAHAQTPLAWAFGSIPYVSTTNKKPLSYCYTDTPLGNSSFMLNSSGTNALMVLGLDYQLEKKDGEPTGTASFSGPAHLQFTSATAGTISYDIVEASKIPVPPVTFSLYSATYDEGAGTLAVSMSVTIAAAEPCTLPVTALYRMP